MNVNEREIPRIILQLDAVQGRLVPHHPKIPLISDEFHKRLAGHKGEVSLDYVLKMLDNNSYFILHGMRLKINDTYFQIDTLLLSRKFIIIIEVKNLAGTIYFDPVFNQMIQIKGSEEIAYPNPLLQVSRQESLLRTWLKQHNYKSIPLYSLVVISNDKAIIKTSSDNHSIRSKVIHKQMLPTIINKIADSVQEQSYTDQELKKVIRLLKKKHESSNQSILERFDISLSEIITGVICEKCSYSPLKRIHGTWLCSKCRNRDPEGHIKALRDYELLIGRLITNRELRSFLHINSRHAASRILKSLNLPTTGTKKATTYDLTHLTKKHQPPHKKPAIK
jgi:ribosomal protein L37AE/L43A